MCPEAEESIILGPLEPTAGTPVTRAHLWVVLCCGLKQRSGEVGRPGFKSQLHHLMPV